MFLLRIMIIRNCHVRMYFVYNEDRSKICFVFLRTGVSCTIVVTVHHLMAPRQGALTSGSIVRIRPDP